MFAAVQDRVFVRSARIVLRRRGERYIEWVEATVESSINVTGGFNKALAVARVTANQTCEGFFLSTQNACLGVLELLYEREFFLLHSCHLRPSKRAIAHSQTLHDHNYTPIKLAARH